jgi:hypothetical protein
MWAVVVTVGIDPARADEAVALRQAAVLRAKAREGFVRGTWLGSSDRNRACSVLQFDTEEQAEAFAAGARLGPPPGAPVTLRSVELFEVMAFT